MPRVRPQRVATYISNFLSCQQTAQQGVAGWLGGAEPRVLRARCAAFLAATSAAATGLAPNAAGAHLCSSDPAAAAPPRAPWVGVVAAARWAPGARRSFASGGTAPPCPSSPDQQQQRHPHKQQPNHHQQQSHKQQSWRARRAGRLASVLGCGPSAAETLARDHPLLLVLGPYALRRLAAAPSLESILAGGPGPVFSGGHGAKAGGAVAASQALFEAVVDGPCSLQMRAMHWGEPRAGCYGAHGSLKQAHCQFPLPANPCPRERV
jgi:hypothetical protein